MLPMLHIGNLTWYGIAGKYTNRTLIVLHTLDIRIKPLNG